MMVMAIKVPVYDENAKISGEIALPPAFEEKVRPDLIKRAAISDQTWFYQPKGPDPTAGMKTSARYRGRKEDYGAIKDHGISMRAREVLPKGRFGKARIIPGTWKGRRAHPPKIEEKLIERINKREYKKALNSALAAAASPAYVSKRGHKLPPSISLPIIFDSSVEEKISKTKMMQSLLLKLGFSGELERAKNAKPRTGVGCRKGGVRRPRSLLLVVSKPDVPLARAAGNIAGVDVVSAKELKVLDLAPGAHPGRLSAFTKPALEALKESSKS
jgi:large subunit ribosomal protein L4e